MGQSANYIKFQINDSKTEIIVKESKITNQELNSLLIKNPRGLLIIESNKVYKYNANMCQDFEGEILDRYTKYKFYNIYQVNFITYFKNLLYSKMIMILNLKKIKKIVKKSLYNFDNHFLLYIKIPTKDLRRKNKT